jgi:parallel beta-helix repeat protein
MRTSIALSLGVVSLLCCAGCPAAVYVDQNSPGPIRDGMTWDTAVLTIQEGIESAVFDNQVWVADGEYIERLVLRQGVEIYGGFKGAEQGGYETSLDQRDILANVTTINGYNSGSTVTMAPASRIDGFTIINGTGTRVGGNPQGGGIYAYRVGDAGVIANNTITLNTAYFGAGIMCSTDSSPLIVGNTIVDNLADFNAGGLACWDSSNPLVTQNLFADNTNNNRLGGGIDCYSSAPTITDNVFIGNYAAKGGAVGCARSSPTVTYNVMVDNTGYTYGGAFHCEDHSSPIVTHNLMLRNSAWKGGGVHSEYYAYPTISNNIIAGNSASWAGGGICVNGCSGPIITNNTLWGNSAPDGAGIGLDSPWYSSNEVWITNCILWDSGVEIWNNDASTVHATFNDVSGGVAGAGNINNDPMLADPANDDFHLLPASPCIDKGLNSAGGMVYQDFDGDPRVCDGDGNGVARVDMGSDEYLPPYEWNACPSRVFWPAWTWFSIPLAPRGSADAAAVLRYDCRNRLFAWDDTGKMFLLYPDDLTTLTVGPAYLAYLNPLEHHAPLYQGYQPQLPFGWTLPAAGWCWVGVPSTQDINGLDLKLCKAGETRTAQQDRSAPIPWLSWHWIFWDARVQNAGIMDPFGAGDDTALHPWWGYRVWSNTEDVTIIFP